MLQNEDYELFDMIEKEKERQNKGLELIPSENIVSKAVLEAMGSVLTNKYSEGYPKKRYYGGNSVIDEIEQLAIDRAKKLFDAEHVNVQPYSGSPANAAIYFAIMEMGDTFLGMRLDHGGHLTHGHKVNFSGKNYNAIQYGVNKEETIDFDQVQELAKKHKPKMIQAGFTAYPGVVDWKAFRDICHEVGAIFFVDMSHISGLVAGKAYPSPIPYADVVMTTTHKSLRGPRGAIILCKEEFAQKIDKAIFPGMQGGPHNHTNAAKAVCFKEALKPEFRQYAEQIIKNAKALASNIDNYRLVSGGTESHLILLDLEQKITGSDAEKMLDDSNVYVNKNTIPYDTRTPFDPSGIRLGTPSITTRGMGENEMKTLGSIITRVLSGEDCKKEIMELCEQFPTGF